MITLHSTWSLRPALVGAALASALFAGPAAAQDAGGPSYGPGTGDDGPRASAPGPGAGRHADLEALRAEVEDLRQQVQALTALVRETRALAAPSAPSRADDAVASTARPAAASAAQPAGAAAAPAETRPSVRLTGTILSTSSFNSADANWIDAPNVVGTASGGSVTSSLRQSRLGVAVDPFAVGGWQASGALELDFFGGTPAVATGAVMPLPRLVTAMATLARGSRSVSAGQDQVIFAPRDPTSLAALATPQFYRAGNLFLRAPHIRVEQRLGARITTAAALVAPVTGDAVPAFTFAPPAGAGERSTRPAFEARAAYAAGSPDADRELQIGASGHVGWLRQFGQDSANGGAALDLYARAGRLGLAGEVFATEDLDAFGAGIAQPGRAAGGWLELRGAVLPRLSLTGGAGLDRRPDGAGTAGRSRNASLFGNVIVKVGPAVSASLEYRWLQTRYVSGRDRVNHHVTAVMALRF